MKYQNFRDKPEEEMSWAEWLASGFKPAYTLEEAVRDPKFYEASAWDDLTQQMAKIGKKLKKDSLTQKKLAENVDSVLRGPCASWPPFTTGFF